MVVIGISTLMSVEGHCPSTAKLMDLLDITTVHVSVSAAHFSIFIVLTYMPEITKVLLIEDTRVLLVFRSKQNTPFSFCATFFVLEIPFLPGFYKTGFLHYFLFFVNSSRSLKEYFSSSTISSPVLTDCHSYVLWLTVNL